MGKRDKKLENAQKGAQEHAEGQHGAKTHEQFLANLQGKLNDGEDDQRNMPERGEPQPGRHRIFEDREQHDEAEKNSERGRLAAELEHDGGGYDSLSSGDRTSLHGVRGQREQRADNKRVDSDGMPAED